MRNELIDLPSIEEKYYLELLFNKYVSQQKKSHT